ncbi:hypothetical protein QR674_00165 [Acinetobacter chinensis]|uniref:YbjN domain-containing protein n=1 Tax=Acinetobacter chinensis TaxID=2004650 RepID=A0ABU3WAH7_9GAMM|nr:MULTISPECIES: hypothetical protein [Acinetobacter]AXY61014.1 hypothetical protein CDG61_13905 [Acinetobacter sp. WCHAc010052]MDV2467404.1 hypothetical protein [Acinetobacter chinensis]WOE41005.1 hypothetical protein QSG87_14180 [Acinetobacter chinensis]
MILPSNQINSQTIANALKNAFIDVIDVEDRGFSVKIEDIYFDVRVDAENERINLQLIHNIAEFSNENMFKLVIASNETNKEKTFIKSSIIEYEDRIFLQIEYTIRYDKGLNMPQFVSDLRFFDRVALASIRDHFRGVV